MVVSMDSGGFTGEGSEPPFLPTQGVNQLINLI